jgi:iron-sulfur cluster repair protein YtfE (RIC family)
MSTNTSWCCGLNLTRLYQIENVGRYDDVRFNAIAKELNAKATSPRRGKRWDHSVISEIIRRESDRSLKPARGEAEELAIESNKNLNA